MPGAADYFFATAGRMLKFCAADYILLTGGVSDGIWIPQANAPRQGRGNDGNAASN